MATAKKKIYEVLTTVLETVKIRNPRTGEKLYEIPCATAAEVAETYARARDAYQVIRKLSVKQRIAEILKLKQYIIQHRNEIIDQNVNETGKDRTVALYEILNAIGSIDNYAKNAEKWLADEIVPTPMEMGKKISKIVYDPVGTVLIIAPWNVPFGLIIDGLLPAFLAGNAVIIKPSEWSLLHGMVEKMVETSGFVKNGIQVIYGAKETGRLCIDAKPSRILFTGSTESAKKVMSHAGQYLIPVVMECGGNDPMVVFDDANIDRAVEAATTGGLFMSGQMCVSVERLVLHEKIHDEFIAKLKKRFAEVTTLEKLDGRPDEGQVEVANMTTDFQIPKIKAHLQDAVEKGAVVLVGGESVSEQTFQLTLIDKVDSSMRISNEETFGPVIAARTFKTEEEAIKISNEINHGLAASVWTKDLKRGERIAREIESGSVTVNGYMATTFNHNLPFGGTKESGVGRYMGRFGLSAFSNIKSLVIDPTDDIEVSWFPYSKEKYQLFDRLASLMEKPSLGNTVKIILTALKLKKLTKKAK